MNIKYKMYLYDLSYLVSNILIKILNPCRIRKNPNGKVVCADPYGLCCDRCRHLGDKGCTVKALSCKLFICRYSNNYHFILTKILSKIRSIAINNDIYCIRCSRQETFHRLLCIERR